MALARLCCIINLLDAAGVHTVFSALPFLGMAGVETISAVDPSSKKEAPAMILPTRLDVKCNCAIQGAHAGLSMRCQHKSYYSTL